MELMRELTIAFIMAIIAAKILELVKPGMITRTLAWMVSRLVPREIRQDHYTDWCAEVAGIRADPDREGPFAATRFVFGQLPFAVHLLKATRRLKRIGDPGYAPWWKWVLTILSIPAIAFWFIPVATWKGMQHLGHGDIDTGLAWLAVAVWQIAGFWYVLSSAVVNDIPVTLSRKKRSALARGR